MRYKIKDTSLATKLEERLKIPHFAAKVLSSYDEITINDLLCYQQKDIVFEQMDQAISCINESIKNNEKIVIMGDYDCDGILATSILVKAFAKKNYEVGYYIPNRISDGYGINIDIVKQFIEKDYKLIITVDNGVNAKEAIEYALAHDVKVIVTDHHNLEPESQCDIIYIHPQYSNLDYYVSGGYVAYCLATAMVEYEDDYLHALAAITLISDVMPLIKGNRLFLRKALDNIQKQQFLQIISLANGFIDSAMIGTIIAPKINSLGRLPDIYNPNKLVQYFCSNNRQSIINYALEIEECNNYRKQMTSDYYNEYSDHEITNNFLMIEKDNLHEGLIGLLASRFSNQYNCVSFVASGEDDIYKASLRSIDGVNIYDIINKHGSLFEKYGGHAQAMGLSYKKENSELIREKISEEMMNIEIEEKEYEVIDLEEVDLTINNITSLRYLEPFGNGFKAPLFLIKNALVANIKGLKGNLHHKINILFDTLPFEVMVFNNNNLDLKVNDHVDIIVKLGLNEFRGKTKISMIVEDYKIK